MAAKFRVAGLSLGGTSSGDSPRGVIGAGRPGAQVSAVVQVKPLPAGAAACESRGWTRARQQGDTDHLVTL